MKYFSFSLVGFLFLLFFLFSSFPSSLPLFFTYLSTIPFLSYCLLFSFPSFYFPFPLFEFSLLLLISTPLPLPLSCFPSFLIPFPSYFPPSSFISLFPSYYFFPLAPFNITSIPTLLVL